LPDAASRRRLLELYARGLELDGVDLEAVVTRAEGFTASFFRELLRKATLASVSEGRPTVTGADIDAALDELMAENAALTRVLLGSGAPGALAAPEPHEWMQQSGAHQTVMLTSRPQGGTVS
jgi:ATP-dependent Zn protease